MGVIFEWEPADNIYQKLFDFDNEISGNSLRGSLATLDGKLYGLSSMGNGFLFEFNPLERTITEKYRLFFSPDELGTSPSGALVVHNNKFYATTFLGGEHNNGVLFEWDPQTNLYSKVYSFDRRYGSFYLSVLGDKLYGVTDRIGFGGGGMLFEWDTNEEVITRTRDFNYQDGVYPNGRLQLVDGKLFGMTHNGGIDNRGTIFKIDSYSHVFEKMDDIEYTDGNTPFGSLTYSNDKFYGASFNGINMLFEWDIAMNKFTKTVSGDLSLSSTLMYGDLTMYNGKLYGMTMRGGLNNMGAIFEWDPRNNYFITKYNFDHGGVPMGSLTLHEGNFYGMVEGSLGHGIIFKWNPVSNEYTVMCDFEVEYGWLSGNLIPYEGKFYAMALFTEGERLGNIFRWDPTTNAVEKMVEFDGSERGSYPLGSLVLLGNKFYGTTYKGGQHNYGVVFEWDPKTNIFTKTVDFNGDNGRSPRLDQLTPVPAPTAKGTPGTCLQLPSLTIDATNNNEWVPITDDKGEAIAEIKANGNVLGNVAVSLYVHDGAVREDSYRKLFLDRNITITPTNQATTPVDVRFYVRKSELEALVEAKNSLDLSSGVDEIARVGIYKTSENSCQSGAVQLTNPVTTVSGTWSEDYVLSASITSFSTFYFAHYDNTPLPLNLISFKAQLQGKDGLLTWKTAQEVNVSHFEVERSVDGKVFSYLGTVPVSSQGDNGTYRFVDKDIAKLLNGMAYYRLKMVDRDGTFSRSSMISLALPEGGSFVSIYPNPVSTKLSVDLKKSGTVSWIITDVNGKQLISGKSENRQFEIDTQQFSAGLYFLQVTSESLVKTVKFVKQ